MEEYPSPAEGIGLENRQGLNGPRGSNPSSSAIIISAGWSSSVARRAHNPKVGGSNPPPAILLYGFRDETVDMHIVLEHHDQFSKRCHYDFYFGSSSVGEQWIEAPCVGSSILS